jgi:Protein of unknown function (DUF2752)
LSTYDPVVATIEASMRAQSSRPASNGLARPLAVAGLAAGGLAYVALRNPTSGGFLPCPFHAITGLWCPGCGMTRALHSLTHGNVAGALSSNLFLPVVIVVVGWAWLAWAVPAVPSITRVVPSWVWTALIGLALVFAVLRNLPVPALQALAP